MSITIRPATAGDAPAIARVRIDGWRTAYRGLVPDAGVDAMDVDASVALRERILMAAPNATSVFVADVANAALTVRAGAARTPREVPDGASAIDVQETA